MNHTRDDYVKALKYLGCPYASTTDLVIDGYDNLIDLNTNANGDPHFLHVCGDGTLFYILATWQDEECLLVNETVCESTRVLAEGLLYSLGARGVKYNPIVAARLCKASTAESVLNEWLPTNTATQDQVALLKSALAAMLDNPTKAEAARQLSQFTQ